MLRNYYLSVMVITSLVLLIPAFAMYIGTEGWDWSSTDFILSWMLLAGVGLGWRFISRKTSNLQYRLASAIVLLTGFMLLWVNGAVGLMGSEEHPANLLYITVCITGLVGALSTRLEPSGMAITAVALALIVLFIPVIAVVLWPADFKSDIISVFAVNLFLALMFCLSALLYRHAGKGKTGQA